MEEISSLLIIAVALFAGLMLSRLAKVMSLPAVTAYLVAGILIGPYLLGALGLKGFGFTSLEDIDRFSIISDVALGFIAFSIGNEFRLAQLKQIGKKATVIGIVQAVAATVLVDAALIGLHFFAKSIKFTFADTVFFMIALGERHSSYSLRMACISSTSHLRLAVNPAFFNHAFTVV